MRKKSPESRNVIKGILIGYAAAFIYMLFSFGITKTSEPAAEVPETVAETTAAPETEPETAPARRRNYSRPASSLKEIAAQEEEEFTPAPDKLNLAYLFPDDADTSDSINSYAGEIYTRMNGLNADFFATYYDLTDTTPLRMAQDRGLGADRVMGRYNPNDSRHDPNNPATWTVNSFKNINVTFYDGDGNRINGYYNAQEIMALASVYAYYHDMEDAEAMEAYCRALFNEAVSAKVSLGNVYYDSGCLNRTIQQEANEVIALENELGEIEYNLERNNPNGYVAVDAQGNPVPFVPETTLPAASETTIGYAVANSDLTATGYADALGHAIVVSEGVTTASSDGSGDASGAASSSGSSGNTVVSVGTGASSGTSTAQTTAAQTTAAATAQTTAAATAQTTAAAAQTDAAQTAAAQTEAQTTAAQTAAATVAAPTKNSIDDNVVVSPGVSSTTSSSDGAGDSSSGSGTGTSSDANISEEPATISEVIDEASLAAMLASAEPGTIFLNGAIPSVNIDEQVVVSPAANSTTAAAETTTAAPETTTAAPETTAAASGEASGDSSGAASGEAAASETTTAAPETTAAPTKTYTAVGASGEPTPLMTEAQTQSGGTETAAQSSSADAASSGNGTGADAASSGNGTAAASGANSADAASSETNAEGSSEAASEGAEESSSAAGGNVTYIYSRKSDPDPAAGDSSMVTESYCPGHIDIYVSITMRGIDDKKGLFKIDPIGNDEANFNDQWQGWTEDKIALAKALCSQDWLENYGLSISSIRVNSPLTEEEIQNYLNSLPSTVSQTRKDIVEFALNSVGKVPYYWGGKPAGPGYENNTFYLLITPDSRGRILKGLDCSGWINWVYWSVTGHSLPGQSTGTLIGCGRKISRGDLQPGDIIIRTGADAHVVMFLCWSQNGNFIGIHETGGITNNVAVKEMTASWPYYRSLLD